MAKNNGATTFIIFVAIVGLVLGGLIMIAPPKTQQDATNTGSQSQQVQVKEDPGLIDRSDAPIIGKEDAKVRLVIFSDYLCPYCVSLHKTTSDILDKYPDNVNLKIRHFIVHEKSQIMSQAAYAASRQGKFKEANGLIFEKYQDGTEDNMVKVARELNLNIDTFKADLTSDAAINYVNKDSADAQALGLGGTPSVFVNNKYLEDSTTLEDKIKSILAK